MAARKTSASRGTARRSKAARKPSGTKRTAARRSTSRRTTAARKKRAATKRATPKGATPKRATPKRATPKRAAPKRAAPKRAAPKRAAPKRAAHARTRTAAKQRRAPAPPAAPSAIGMSVQHLDYTSHAMDEVKRFYTEWLGFAQFEHDDSTQYLRITTGPSSSLGFMPPMPGPPEHWRPPREPHLYLIVENVDRAYHDLLGKGATFEQAPTDMPWGHRVAVARDPEGRAVCLAEIKEP